MKVQELTLLTFITKRWIFSSTLVRCEIPKGRALIPIEENEVKHTRIFIYRMRRSSDAILPLNWMAFFVNFVSNCLVNCSIVNFLIFFVSLYFRRRWMWNVKRKKVEKVWVRKESRVWVLCTLAKKKIGDILVIIIQTIDRIQRI